MIAIDILYLVDRLEALLNQGWRVPLTSKTMIDEDEFLDIVDQMRIAIPEEIKLAKKMQQDRERVLAQTQEEAARVLAQAKEDAARLVNEHAVIKAAQERAAEIAKRAQDEAVATHRGADAYAAQVLSEIQARLDQVAQQVAGMQTQIANGINVITEHRVFVDPPSNVDQDVS
jgi:hypothetical protein